MTEESIISESRMIGRRGELLAELFLQELNPLFVAQPTNDITFDLVAGFLNPKGGINAVAVEVKATQKSPAKGFLMRAESYRRLSFSNIPVLFLVIDVKANTVFYTWPDPARAEKAKDRIMVNVPVVEVTQEERAKLKARLSGEQGGVGNSAMLLASS